MTSKEALKIIETYNFWNGAEEITGNTCVNPIYLEAKKHYEEAKDRLENDLEVLEIIKSIMNTHNIKDITELEEVLRKVSESKKNELRGLEDWIER